MSATEKQEKSRAHAARWGLGVFALGIVLLLLVFVFSYMLFASTSRIILEAENLQMNAMPPLSDVLTAAGLKLAFLIVMGIVSSLIAGKGLSLYGTTWEGNQ